MTKTALITGSTSGIGKAAAYCLATYGWRVIIHGREEENCLQVAEEIRNASKNPYVDYLSADLSSLAEVEQMADQVKLRFPDLNVLINNAGTYSKSRKLTVDELELTWVVNYLSRFILTNSLIDLLDRNGPSRIVDVSGMYHSKGEIYFEDINLSSDYTLGKANNQSKLANVLHTYKLARELQDKNITVNSLHPGAVNTGSIYKAEGISSFTKFMYRLMALFFLSPEKGAESLTHLASSPMLEGVSGKYFHRKKERTSGKKTYELDLQDRLWELSHEMVEQYRSVKLS